MGRRRDTWSRGTWVCAHVTIVMLVMTACTSATSTADQETEREDPVASAPTQTAAATPAPRPTRTPEQRPTARPATARQRGKPKLELDVVADRLNQPIHVTAPPGDPRLFIVEKVGRIRIVEDGELADTPFLDIRTRVLASGQTSEQGMYALAFHPDYASNGRFFVHYAARPNGNTRVEEYRVSDTDPGRSDPGTRRVILRVKQPFRWHNGGMMRFGPDGMLWLGLGDGGVKNDPSDHGQNPRTLLGTILRLDVD